LHLCACIGSDRAVRWDRELVTIIELLEKKGAELPLANIPYPTLLLEGTSWTLFFS
jgi:hypothetical protein